MSSSDSDDGYYSNVVKNMRIAREECRKNLESARSDIVKSAGKNDQNNVTVENENTVKNVENEVIYSNTADASFIESIEDDLILDEIIAKNSKPARGRGRGRGRGSKKKETTLVQPPKTLAEPVISKSRGRGKGQRKGGTELDADRELCNEMDPSLLTNYGRGKRRRNESNSLCNNSSLLGDILNNLPGSRRGRGGKRCRPSFSPNSSVEEAIQSVLTGNVRTKGRGRQRGRGRGRQTQPTIPVPSTPAPSYPTYSVGNTDEYYDKSDDIPLFVKPTCTAEPTNVTDNVVLVDSDDNLDNEPLPLKVVWKSLKIYKFNIRKYHKLTPIFESFAQVENVSKNNLLFTYNNKILTCDDTPASIDYNIAKFIDGGVVSHSVKSLVHEKTKINGIQIKFQCQNRKKPLEIMIGKDDKLLLGLTECAECLELPLEKLKFEFDGDTVIGTTTPQQLGLENGDCIDVKILS